MPPSFSTSTRSVRHPTSGEFPRTGTRSRGERNFLTGLYVASFAIRLLVGGAIYLAGYTGYFAADATSYDAIGWIIARSWAGDLQNPKPIFLNLSNLGLHGMYYWVAGIYSVIGHAFFAAVVIQIAVISFTPLLIYMIAREVYSSIKVAKAASLLVAFLPCMVIWSSSLLKDPIVVFLLCITVFCTLKTQRRTQFRYLLPGAAAMMLIYPIRGYVFYFILLSVVGALLLSRFGRGVSVTNYFVRVGGIAFIAVTLFFLDFDSIAGQQARLNVFEMMQSSRSDLAHRAASGYEEKADISTIGAAMAFLPKGIIYLLFAPFPWQTGSTRQMLAIPDTLLWYGLFPFCLSGLVYTLRRHLRDTIIILLFVAQLTFFYAIFIGNIGTAHRQRTQILVFYLIFAAVGLVSWRQRKRGRGTIADSSA